MGMGEDEAGKDESVPLDRRCPSAEKYVSSIVAAAVGDDMATGGSGAVMVTGIGRAVWSLASLCTPFVAASLCCCLLRRTACRLNFSAVMYCSMSKHAYMMSSCFTCLFAK